ncbi:MAG: ribbon-helix-helix protein, CopG family [Sulfolobales archaeon]|nr:ribbon-helix-helix protein, CopG family [Sulfolobales archaeon]
MVRSALSMRVITFKLSDEVVEAVDRYALEHMMTRSEVIRLAIRNFISSYEISYKPPKVKRLVIR